MIETLGMKDLIMFSFIIVLLKFRYIEDTLNKLEITFFSFRGFLGFNEFFSPIDQNFYFSGFS